MCRGDSRGARGQEVPVTPSCREKLATGPRVGGGQVRSSSPAGGEERLRANSARAEWALAAGRVVLPAAELPAAAAGRAGAPRAQLHPELRLPRRAPAAAGTWRPSASRRRRRLRPPPLLREDESGLHISTSELKGETEEGGGGQACLRLETLKAC